MKLQIEKNLLALTHNLPHKIGPFSGKELVADLEEPDTGLQLTHELEGFYSAIDVEGDDDLIHRRHLIISLARSTSWTKGSSRGRMTSNSSRKLNAER